jgi:hypothetical protein
MAAFKAGELQFFNDLIELSDAAEFATTLASLRSIEWAIYAKRPFMNAAAVLAYLARYAHRVAITNRRLLGLDETHLWRGIASRAPARKGHGRNAEHNREALGTDTSLPVHNELSEASARGCDYSSKDENSSAVPSSGGANSGGGGSRPAKLT